jgi:hypothetical protein
MAGETSEKMQVLDDLKEMRRYWKLKEEAWDGTLWRTSFGGGYGPLIEGRWWWRQKKYSMSCKITLQYILLQLTHTAVLCSQSSNFMWDLWLKSHSQEGILRVQREHFLYHSNFMSFVSSLTVYIFDANEFHCHYIHSHINKHTTDNLSHWL